MSSTLHYLCYKRPPLGRNSIEFHRTRSCANCIQRLPANHLMLGVNILRCENAYRNVSLPSLNITNILKSKVVLNDSDDMDTNDVYNRTDMPEDDYVDFSLLHPDEAQNLYRVAKQKSVMVEDEYNKTIGRQARQSKKNRLDESYWSNPFFVSKAMDLMTQSVYATRYRLRETSELRRRISSRVDYKGALMYGSLMQLRIKMDNLYTTMKKFKPRETKFLWYLVLYERCLSFHVDVSQMVKDMFELDREFRNMDEDEDGKGPTGPPRWDD